MQKPEPAQPADKSDLESSLHELSQRLREQIGWDRKRSAAGRFAG